MVASKPQAGAHEGDNKHSKAAQSQQGRSPATPPHGQTFMQENCINHPGDEGQNFFRVKAEKTSQGVLGIEGPNNNASSEKRKAHGEAPVIESIQLLKRRQTPVKKTELLLLNLSFLHQVEETSQAG